MPKLTHSGHNQPAGSLPHTFEKTGSRAARSAARPAWGLFMTGRTIASDDAVQSFAETGHGAMIRRLRPRGRREGRQGLNGRPAETLRQVSASLGLGALLTFGSAGSATAPALALDQERSLEKADIPLPDPAEPLVTGAVALPEVEPVFAAPIAIASAPVESRAVAEIAPVWSLEVLVPLAVEIVLPPGEEVADAPIALPPAFLVPQGEAEAGATYAALKDPARATDAGEAPITRIVVPAPGSEAASRDERDPDEILQFEDMRVPRWIAETILRAAEATGVDPVYMMALADKESSFIPASKASTSSAEGLFQFLESTWLEMVKRFGAQHGLTTEADAIEGPIGDLAIEDETMREHVLNLRRDPYLSALMAAEMMKRDRGRVERRLGRPITRSEFYLAHFLGVESASKFMSLLDERPKQSAPRNFPAAARANKSLFFDKKGKKTRQLSVAEVHRKLDEMIDRRLDRYEAVERVVTTEARL